MNRSQKLLHLLIASIMVLSLFGASVAVGPEQPLTEPLKVHPLLAKVADETPDQVVSVIVQSGGDVSHVQEAIDQLGGQVTRDLHIINALTVELSAEDALTLSEAEGVRWVSLDAPITTTGKPIKNPTPEPTPEPTPPPTGGGGTAYYQYYLETMNVHDAWDMGLDGDGITIAVIDSGVLKEDDFAEKVKGKSASRVVRQFSLNPDSNTVNDVYGHGTHVAGIAAGNGKDSNGEVSGVAPMVDLISIKISDENGRAYESDTVYAMQWVLENAPFFNIRVVNLSIRSAVEQSYHTSPLDAAAEILWFNGIVVVAAAGNEGPGAIDVAPANDPFIITVGAADEKQTPDLADDVVAPYSAYGVTMDGHLKPDLVAPGQDIVSLLSDASSWGSQYPDRVAIDGNYFRLSGTSMSTPMVAGAVALLLQDEPDLTPDQVKYRLTHTGPTIQGSGDDTNSYPYLDVYAAVTGTTTESANTDLPASQMLWTGDEPVLWNSVNWNSVNWNSVNWNSVNWNSVNWNSVNWNSVAWEY